MHNILNEFDHNKTAVINPQDIIAHVEGFPKVCIGAFSKPIVDKLAVLDGAEKISEIATANGVNPVYKICYKDTEIAFFMAPVGAALCVAEMEELIAKGVSKFVYMGSCGVLDSSIADGHIIVPTSAMRDEGTSYHYCPPSEEISLSEDCIKSVVDTLEDLKLPYVKGKVWTTDAFYRETPDKIMRRQASGCIAVEMECSALTAAAQFREVLFAQFLYAADNLDSEQWEARGLSDQGLFHSDKYVTAAFEIAVKL